MRGAWALLWTLACDPVRPSGFPGGGTVDTDSGGDGGGVVEGDGLSVAVHDTVETVLVATWVQDAAADEVWLEYRTDEGVWTTPARALGAGLQSEVILGLPADTDVEITWRGTAAGAPLPDRGPLSARTGSLPRDLVEPTLLLHDPLGVSAEPFVLTSVNVGPEDFFGPCYTVVVDRQGRVVWYWEVSDSRLNLFSRVARDGTHIVVDATTYYVFDDVESSLTRLDLDLDRVEEVEVAGMGLTWDELDDGSFLFDHAASGYDYHLERLYPDGTRTRIWSCAPWMDAYTDRYWACAANTVLWSADRGTALWSMFETSTVAEIDLETGALRGWFGQTPGSWEIASAGVQLELQHYPNWTPEGTIVLTTHVPGASRRQVQRELALDEDAGTLTEVWSYESAEGWYGEYAGDVTRLSGGGTLIGYGTGGIIEEIDADSAPVWVLDWDGHMTGHSTPIADLYALR